MANKSKPAQPAVPVASIEHDASAFENFVDEHKVHIVIGIAAVLAIFIGYMVMKYRSQANFSAAAGVLTAAETVEDLRKVVSDYPGKVVAGSALLLIADKLQEEDKADESYATLKEFVDSFKDHPLYPKGVSDLALKEQDKGNFDEAITLLREVTAAAGSDAGFAEQYALLRLGDALTAKGLAAMKSNDVDTAKGLFDEAKAAYDDLIDRSASDGLKRTAEERSERLPHLSITPTTPEAAAASTATKAEEEAAAAVEAAAEIAPEATVTEEPPSGDKAPAEEPAAEDSEDSGDN